MKRIFIAIFSLVLFTCNTAFSTTSAAKEFTSGNHTKFSTAGHPKSKGLNMELSYPNSWLAKEGERPNIVQKFISDGGRGLEMALVITKSLPLPKGTVIPENELKKFFTPAEMKKGIPPGYKFLSTKPTTIDGVPAGILEYSMQQDRAGEAVFFQIISYNFILGTTMVQLQCAVGATQSTPPAVLAQRMDAFKPLFFLMANSIVLQDQY